MSLFVAVCWCWVLRGNLSWFAGNCDSAMSLFVGIDVAVGYPTRDAADRCHRVAVLRNSDNWLSSFVAGTVVINCNSDSRRVQTRPSCRCYPPTATADVAVCRCWCRCCSCGKRCRLGLFPMNMIPTSFSGPCCDNKLCFHQTVKIALH